MKLINLLLKYIYDNIKVDFIECFLFLYIINYNITKMEAKIISITLFMSYYVFDFQS